MGTHELEVSFLAACLALPEPGREYLLAIDEELLLERGVARGLPRGRRAVSCQRCREN